ncbi:MAG TPA: ThiF family adenylyltransferase [Longimicrobium sp.]
MSRKLVSRNEDLGRLVEKGYAVGFAGGYLVVRDIPYLDGNGELRVGALVTKLVDIGQDRVQQDDHQVFFAGGVPHELDGTPIRNLGGGAMGLHLPGCPDVVVERSFSNKPSKTGRFADFFEKIESYVAIISGPAMERFDASPYTFRMVEEAEPDPIFKLRDTLTSRAEIGDLSAKFSNDVVAVIGLGGTGAYLLDLLVKTPVREIRAFDRDAYHVHNAFRSPGRLEPDEELGKSKAAVYEARYDNFRHGLKIHEKYIDADSAEDLDGITFAFVCVDKGSSRAEIFGLLISLGIPFIDVGMGLSRKFDTLRGMVRTTYYPASEAARMRDMQLAELKDRPDNLYRANIQIGELNALNACLAIIRFKQLRGFYHEEGGVNHLLFDIADLKTVGESYGDAV